MAQNQGNIQRKGVKWKSEICQSLDTGGGPRVYCAEQIPTSKKDDCEILTIWRELDCAWDLWGNMQRIEQWDFFPMFGFLMIRM